MPQEYAVKNFNRRQIRLEDMLLHRCKGMQRICYVICMVSENNVGHQSQLVILSLIITELTLLSISTQLKDNTKTKYSSQVLQLAILPNIDQNIIQQLKIQMEKMIIFLDFLHISILQVKVCCLIKQAPFIRRQELVTKLSTLLNKKQKFQLL